MRVLIFGGTGLVGRELVKVLFQQDHQIDVVSRNPKIFEEGSGKVSCVSADLSDPDWLTKSSIDFNQYQVIFHLVYANKADQSYNRQVLVNSLRQLLDHLEASPEKNLKHFVYTGSMAVFGQNHVSPVVNEMSEKVPDTPYAQLKIEATQMLLEDKGPFLKTILHPTGVYGPVSTRIENYRDILRENYIPFLSGALGINNIVHAEDVAQGLVRCLERPSTNMTEEYIVNGEEIFYHEWFRCLESTLAKKKVRKLPLMFKKVTRGFIRRMFNLMGFSCPLNIPEYKLQIYESQVKYSSQKARKDFGFQPTVVFKEFCQTLK